MLVLAGYQGYYRSPVKAVQVANAKAAGAPVHCGAYDLVLCCYLGEIFAGTQPASADIPVGAKLWVRK